MYQPDTVPPVPIYPPESINIYIERRKRGVFGVSTSLATTCINKIQCHQSHSTHQRVLIYTERRKEDYCIWCFGFMSHHMYQPDTVPPVPHYLPESINIY
jgi:hypothetical protein